MAADDDDVESETEDYLGNEYGKGGNQFRNVELLKLHLSKPIPKEHYIVGHNFMVDRETDGIVRKLKAADKVKFGHSWKKVQDWFKDKKRVSSSADSVQWRMGIWTAMDAEECVTKVKDSMRDFADFKDVSGDDLMSYLFSVHVVRKHTATVCVWFDESRVLEYLRHFLSHDADGALRVLSSVMCLTLDFVLQRTLCTLKTLRRV